MKTVTVVLCCLFSLQLYALNKSSLDIRMHDNSLAKSGEIQTNHFGSKTVENDVTAYSMMIGGYFTMGITGGMASQFDDDCNLTFGHPYALTSYPIFAVDGEWSKLDEIVSNWSLLTPEQNGATLEVHADVQNNVNVVFQLLSSKSGRAIDVLMTIRNSDTQAHSLGMGLVFDPALGQWEEGHLHINGAVVDKPQVYSGDEIPPTMQLWERDQQPLGLGVDLQFGENPPDKLIAANWAELYNDQTPDYSVGEMNQIYDLCLKFIWSEQEIQPNSERSWRLTFALQEPDFSSQVFTRWDMPSALSLENNVLFPHRMNTTVRTMNTASTNLRNLNINVDYPSEFSGTDATGAFQMNTNSNAWHTLMVTSSERYEDMIVPITLTCEQGGKTLDQITRNVFIPATPVSDEGLIVSIDSLIADNFPQTSLIFSAENEETGQRLLNLHKENLFLYDNGNRIREFSMDKFGGGGSKLADICFVLDCSSSMGDNIDAVRNNLGEFADSLRERGFDFRIATVTFSTTVDDVWDFTNDVELMKQRLAGISLWGGVENSPAALYKASELSWRPGSKRNIIWVTDEAYPEHSYTQEQIVNRMLSLDIKVHGVGLLELQTDWFNPIVLPSGGNFYNIFGNFRDILLDVARMKSQDRYIVTFDLSGGDDHTVKLKIHYAGLGGYDTIEINGSAALAKQLSCYPNPFNPFIKIMVDAFDGTQGDVGIYNVLGQRIRHFSLLPHQATEIIWNARDDNGLPVSSGFFFVTLSIQQTDGQLKQNTQKILYLK